MKIAIVGLGYVGLPLAIQFARANVPVLGLDIDPEKVNSINEGRSYIRHIAPGTISEEVKGSDCERRPILAASRRSRQWSFVSRHR